MKDLIKHTRLVPLMVLLFSSFALTSCSDDNKDEPDSSSESVVGVWRHDFSTGYRLLTFEKNGEYSEVEFDKAGGNWSESGTYSIKGNVMTRVLSDGDVEVYSILTHTAKKLILRYEGKYIGQYDQYYDDDFEDWTRVE